MSSHSLPPSPVRNTYPGCDPAPFQPEYTTLALFPSRGCVAIQVAARFGSTGLLGRGGVVTSAQFAPSSSVTHTRPFNVVAQIVPGTPLSYALWMLRM